MITNYNSKQSQSDKLPSTKLTCCPHCNLSFMDNVIDTANHVRWCNENPKNTKYKHGKTINCSSCGILFSLISNKDRRKTCSKECASTTSNYTKNLLSINRKEYLTKNPDKHSWKNQNKHISIPCENVKNYLIENKIQFIEEYSPIKDRHFSIDIAFPNLKIGIEINGNQHYNNDGILSPYYKERHDLIENEGWKLIEVHYSRCFSIESISKILDFDIPFDSNEEILRIKNIINKPKNIPLKRGEKIKNITDNKWLLIKNDIFNYDIDFTKFGWVTKVAKILNIKPQKVNEWMKRYHSEFYNKCFHRSN